MAQTKTVICFCKHPEPGMVKSRLSADLGTEYAADIYKILLEKTLQNICITELEVFLYCYPNINHAFLNYCSDKYNVSLYKQEGDDLGSRMFNAMNNHLSPKQNVLLIGSDCLELDFNYINDAYQTLEAGSDVVIGPSLDGGYALVGANRLDASIFSSISWSTSNVLEQTKERIKNLGWTTTCMPRVRDIDTLVDYQYFSQHEKFKYLFFDVNKKYTSTC